MANMDWDLAQLRAFSAVLREGSFDAAARALHVTPSAVSQRIKALELATGRVLLVRSKPARPTDAGEAVLRLARQVDQLTADVAAELSLEPEPGRRARIAMSVNADSLHSWLLPALAPLASDYEFELHRADQAHTAALVRAGMVAAAVTEQREPPPGCTSQLLGRMRYHPMAAPDFVRRWFPAGPSGSSLAQAPMVVFDRDDDLQHRYLRRRLRRAADNPPTHYVPGSADFVRAVALGMGWGMVPEAQRHQAPELEVLDPGGSVAVVLYWQQWKLGTSSLDRVRAAVVAAARAALA